MTDGAHVILTTPKGRVQATCIHVWHRGQCDWIMSNSSGPKECMVNDAMSLFGKFSTADAVALMSLPGPLMLYLVRAPHGCQGITKNWEQWYDVMGVRAQISEVAE